MIGCTNRRSGCRATSLLFQSSPPRWLVALVVAEELAIGIADGPHVDSVFLIVGDEALIEAIEHLREDRVDLPARFLVVAIEKRPANEGFAFIVVVDGGPVHIADDVVRVGEDEGVFEAVEERGEEGEVGHG